MVGMILEMEPCNKKVAKPLCAVVDREAEVQPMDSHAANGTTPLRMARRSHRLTLQELSDLTGIDPSVISRVERGERDLGPMERVRISRALGIRNSVIFPAEALAGK